MVTLILLCLKTRQLVLVFAWYQELSNFVPVLSIYLSLRLWQITQTSALISNGNGTEWSPIQSEIIQMITKSEAQRTSDLFITSMIRDRVGRHEVLSPINHQNYNFWEKKNIQFSYEIKGKFALKDWQRRPKLFHCLIGWFKLLLWIRLVDLIYISEGGWLLELSDNKLSD